jgi:hypothetical protein
MLPLKYRQQMWWITCSRERASIPWWRWSDLIFMLHEAEANHDVEAYMTAMKFLVNVFCASHQTHYVDLNTDFAKTWFCASEAERKMYEELFLFRKTKNGSSIFGDRYVEWCVRMVRDLTGKKSTGDNHKVAVSQAVLLLNDFTKIKSEAKNEKERVLPKSPTEADRKSLHLTNVFFEAFTYSHDLNQFGPGPPRHVPAKPSKIRSTLNQDEWEEASETELRSPSGTSIVNPELCSYYSTGTERAEEYFTKFLVTGDLGLVSHTEKKEDGGVPLTAINPSSVDVDTKRKSQIQRTVSTDASSLKATGKNSVYTTVELKAELVLLNTELLEIPGKKKVKATKNTKNNVDKSSLADAVVNVREQLIENDGTWAARRLESQQQIAASTTESIHDRLEREFELQFYTLAETEARKKYGEKKHSFVPPSPGNQQSNPPGTVESPAAQAQESQETNYSFTSSPSTPGGLNLGHAVRKEFRDGLFQLD